MTSPTVNNKRVTSLVPRIAALDADPARREAVALGLVDALLEADEETLAAALDALRDARAGAKGDGELAGWLDAALAFAHWGLERVPSEAAVEQGTQAHDFLRMLEGSAQLGSAELRRLLETDETQVSRTGRRLLETGLVNRRKVGRQVFWQLTPRGKQAAEQPSAERQAPDSEFWQAAVRRGFEAASGDEPGEPREVDPTRERIIECTLELHLNQGIQATTFDDVADSVGLPVDEVKAIFPTQYELTRSCGAHFVETLQLPPAERVPEVFAGASSETERIRRLVQTTFGVYERGADGIALGRRERREVPAANEAMATVDNSLDALVSETLRPLSQDSSSASSLRALTDLEVWRVLRDQGATPAAAVDQASEAVERWLEAQPA